MNQDVQAIADFARDQMDGAQVPPKGSAAIEQLSTAIANVLQHKSNQEFAFLGRTLLGAVIDRARAGITAESTLLAFIQPGADHD